MTTLHIATDGSCIQQGDFRAGDDTARPGAAGFVAKLPDGSHVGKAQPYPNGTIGTMEIKGLRMALEFADAMVKADPSISDVRIKCDSKFVVDGYNEWLKGWAAKNYHKKGGLTGADDWRAIDGFKQALGDRIQVGWVRGHSGDPLNERCDELVNTSARSQRGSDTTALALGASAAVATVETVEPAPEAPAAPMGGIRAQAERLLAQAASNPELSALLAAGLEMALDERRLTARLATETVDQAQALHAALERSAGR